MQESVGSLEKALTRQFHMGMAWVGETSFDGFDHEIDAMGSLF